MNISGRQIVPTHILLTLLTFIALPILQNYQFIIDGLIGFSLI